MPSSAFHEPDAGPSRPGRHARRPRTSVAAAAGVAVVLIAGAAVWASRAGQRPHEVSAPTTGALLSSSASPTVSVSAPASPAAIAKQEVPRGGWIPVDQAAWNAQVARYKAKDHVAFGTNERCPADHPVRIPALTFDIAYGAKGSKAGYYVSSDPTGKSASSMHGDAFLMWDPNAMNQRVRNCIAQRRTCNNDGYDPFSY